MALITFALYAWGLDRNGWANTYYAAAVAAGTKSWEAFFFGSLDAGNFITVDKPPASLWLMELSTRVFGLSSWSMLLPEALAGVACVLLLFFAVRRSFGPVAGLLAAAVMAVTPVTVLMFRFNNPDALLTLLLVASAWSLVRALEAGRTRWLLLAAGLVGLAFNTKDLQAFIVLPALALTYFLSATGSPRRRFLQLLAAGGVLLVSSGWWLTIVDLIPAASRPYVGGSTDNSVLNLVLGYNGLGRVFGQGARGGGGANPGGPGGAGFGGQAGLLRLFNAEIGGQVAWLVPLAAAALVIGLWMHRRGRRTDPARAGYVLWGIWLVTHFAVFSFASGIFHPYYTVALAPAVAALAGAGALEFWRLRSRSLPGTLLVVAVLTGTAWWGRQLLERTPSLAPGLGTIELALAAAASLVIAGTRWSRLARTIPAGVPMAALGAGVCALLLGPAAYALATVNHGASGSVPLAGPAAGVARASAASGGPPDGRGASAAGGGSALDARLVAYLERNQGGATWLVAVPSAMPAASIELSTGKAVLAMGGFSGSDPAPTASQLARLVASGKLRFVLLGGRGGARMGNDAGRPGRLGAGQPADPPPGAGPSPTSATEPGGASGRGPQQAVRWVQTSCSPVTSAGVSGLYDCATAATGS